MSLEISLFEKLQRMDLAKESVRMGVVLELRAADYDEWAPSTANSLVLPSNLFNPYMQFRMPPEEPYWYIIAGTTECFRTKSQALDYGNRNFPMAKVVKVKEVVD